MKQFTFALLVGLWLLPSLSTGHGTIPEMNSKVQKVALEDFELASTGEVISTYRGIKSWPSEDKFKVKIYLDGNKELRMTCEEVHEATGETIVCGRVSE